MIFFSNTHLIFFLIQHHKYLLFSPINALLTHPPTINNFWIYPIKKRLQHLFCQKLSFLYIRYLHTQNKNKNKKGKIINLTQCYILKEKIPTYNKTNSRVKPTSSATYMYMYMYMLKSTILNSFNLNTQTSVFEAI